MLLDEKTVMKWFHTDFLRHWKELMELNKKLMDEEPKELDKKEIIFPFIPIKADPKTIQNLIALILKYLFQLKTNSFIICIQDQKNSTIWAGLQKVEGFYFTDLLELDPQQINSSNLFTIKDKQERIESLKKLLKQNLYLSDLDFYLLLNIEVISKFKLILEEHTDLLDFYSKIWDLMGFHFINGSIEFFPEPLFFKFLRRLTTKNAILKASEFKKIFGNLLPTQNILVNFLDKQYLSSIVISTKPNHLQLQFPPYSILKNQITRLKVKQNDELTDINKSFKAGIPIMINNQQIEPIATITLTESFWLTLQEIMVHNDFEYMMEKIFEFIKKIEENWALERNLILFRRWGKSFMRFNIDQLLPSQPINVFSSVLSFLNVLQTRTMWFIVNDQLELLYILGVDFEEGKFKRLYMVSDQYLYELFNSESDKVLAITKAHYYLAENGSWVNQMIGITVQDLNQLITFLPLLTSVKGSLKYLAMIENIITYRTYFYPPNFFADLIARKGSTYFFKNIWFPMIINNF